MHANLRWEPRFKQRFEFGALGARGSRWAADKPKAVRRLNELAHTAGVPCAGTPASVPCRGKESKRVKRSQHLKVGGVRTANGQRLATPPAVGRVVPLGSLRSPSFHNPPSGGSQKEYNPDKTDIEENI